MAVVLWILIGQAAGVAGGLTGAHGFALLGSAESEDLHIQCLVHEPRLIPAAAGGR